MKVVKILWEDSCNSNLNWVTKEDVEVELVNIDSFGVVVKETDEFVSIAQNYGSEPEQFSNIVTIPRGCIKEIFVIHDDSQLNEKQNPTWSEEDETMIALLHNIIGHHYSMDIIKKEEQLKLEDWLKSFKNRVQPKQEWSEEDEERIEQICSDLKCGMINFYANEVVKGLHYKEIIESNIDWLKSLRPQNRWKPSEEQMQVLQWCMPLWSEPKTKAVLESLIADLKKLKS